MGAFVITRKHSEFLDTPTHRAGPDDKDEAIVVFTTRRAAEKYVEDAGWATEYEVGELRSIQLLRWVLIAFEQGTDMVVVNPSRKRHLAGEPQSVVFLNEPLDTFAELLRSEFIKQAAREEATSHTARSSYGD